MARRLRVAPGGIVYHVLNRAVGRRSIFREEWDYLAFEKILLQAHERTGTPLLAYCVMPNHWHLLLRPRRDGELSQYVRWLSVTHTQRWHAHHRTSGTGPLYQGRFKSFPVQDDRHFMIVARYIERNPVRANLADRAIEWRWSSANGIAGASKPWLTPPRDWPVPRPRDWRRWVDKPQTSTEELEQLRRSVNRGVPFGDDSWTTKMARRLSLQSSLRPPHRPKQGDAAGQAGGEQLKNDS